MLSVFVSNNVSNDVFFDTYFLSKNNLGTFFNNDTFSKSFWSTLYYISQLVIENKDFEKKSKIRKCYEILFYDPNYHTDYSLKKYSL